MDVSSLLEKLSGHLGSLSEDFRVLRELLTGAEGRPAPVAVAPEQSLRTIAAFLAVGPTLQEDGLLRVLLRCAMHVTDAGGAGLTLFDADRRRLIFRVAVGDGSEGVLGYEVPLEGSIHGLAFATGEIQAATPLHTRIETAVGVAFRSVLVAPLIVDDEPIGTMSAVNKRHVDQFTSRDMEAYKWFSDLAAIIVRQHLRQSVLLRALESDLAGEPGRLPGFSLSDQDRRLLRIVDQVVTRARGSDRCMSFLEGLLPMLPVK